MSALREDVPCQRCHQPLGAHTVYWLREDIPAGAVEGIFAWPSEIRGWYCPDLVPA